MYARSAAIDEIMKREHTLRHSSSSSSSSSQTLSSTTASTPEELQNKWNKDKSSMHSSENTQTTEKSTTSSPSASPTSSSPSRRHRSIIRTYQRGMYLVLFRTLEGLLTVHDWLESVPGVRIITNLLETYLMFPSTTNIRSRMKLMSLAIGLGDIGGGEATDGSFRSETSGIHANANTNVNTNPSSHSDTSNMNDHQQQPTNPMESIPMLKERTLRMLTNKYGDSIPSSSSSASSSSSSSSSFPTSSFSFSHTTNNNHFSTHPTDLYRALRFHHNASEPMVITLMHDTAPQYIYLPHPLWTLAPLGIFDPTIR